MIWSLVLEEGRGGFMDSSKYREVMTGLFFRGEVPAQEVENSDGSRTRKVQTPPKSKLDELRAFQEQIAARAQQSDVASAPSE